MRRGRGKGQASGDLGLRKKRDYWWACQLTVAGATAYSFLLGSSFFLVGSTSRLFRDISGGREATRIFVLTPYFLGSLFFTTGCFLPLPRVLSHYHRLQKQHSRRRLKGRNDREVEKVKHQSYIAKIDVIGAVLAVSGGLMINSATSIDLYMGSRAELIFTTDLGPMWTITLPTMCGRALFILAGWFTWAARNQSWTLRLKHGSKHFWWTTVLFWLGTCMFYAGWFCTECPIQIYPTLLVKNWCCVLGGYILGSMTLMLASYVMVLELAKSSEIQTRHDSDVESPLIQY